MTDENKPSEPNNRDSMSKERQRIYDRQISPMLSGSVEGALIDVPLTPEEEAMYANIAEQRTAKQRENKTWDINWVMKQEEECEDWDDYIGMQCAELGRKTCEARDAGNFSLADKLDREWKGWILLRRLGIEQAQKTGLGKKALLHVYNERQALEEKIAEMLKKKEEEK